MLESYGRVIHFTDPADRCLTFPIKPEASIQLDTGVTTSPWNAIGYTTMAFYPLVIGLTYLLSLDVSFSCWFFYLFTKMQNVGATAFGFRDPGAGPTLAHMPYIAEQGVGAFVGLALYSLWLARPHLTETHGARHFEAMQTVDDSDEPMSYRAAYLGLFMVRRPCCWSASGSPWACRSMGLAAVLGLAAPAGDHVHAHPGRSGLAVGTRLRGATSHGTLISLRRDRVASRRAS